MPTKTLTQHNHRTSVLGADREYRGVCSCGWTSPTVRPTRAQAESDADDHVVYVTRGEP